MFQFLSFPLLKHDVQEPIRKVLKHDGFVSIHMITQQLNRDDAKMTRGCMYLSVLTTVFAYLRTGLCLGSRSGVMESPHHGHLLLPSLVQYKEIGNYKKLALDIPNIIEKKINGI